MNESFEPYLSREAGTAVQLLQEPACRARRLLIEELLVQWPVLNGFALLP